MTPKKEVKPKTAAEIAAEIKALTAIRPKVRRYSLFGEDNHARIDAEIAVLREDLDDDAIYDRFQDEANPDENPPELDAALHARQWMDGHEKDGLADGWRPLTDEKKK